MLKIKVGIFLILIAYSETSPKGSFVSDSFIFRSKLQHRQLAELIQMQLGITLIKPGHMWILYAESWGDQNMMSTGV